MAILAGAVKIGGPKKRPIFRTTKKATKNQVRKIRPKNQAENRLFLQKKAHFRRTLWPKYRHTF
jgi:hypothetical protein